MECQIFYLTEIKTKNQYCDMDLFLLPNAMILFFISIILTHYSEAYEYGIDRLDEVQIIQSLKNQNLAVLAHAASVDKNGNHLIDLLNSKFKLKKIFVPEHGLRSLKDGWVEDGIDEKSQLPVISLYKSSSRAPRPDDLMDIDTIVIDLQDVGVRYYTYFSTVAEFIKVATSLQKKIVILDRPNPLGGIVEGETLDTSLMGKFISYWNIPTRHGMTLGELSRLFISESNLDSKLTIVEVKDWFREPILNLNERKWVPSSPALLTLEQVFFYALWGSLEQFNLSVGRGLQNDLAFKVIAAPWISTGDAEILAKELNAQNFKGINFAPVSFQVTRDIYLGQKVNGIKIFLEKDFDTIRTDEFSFKISAFLFHRYSSFLQFSLAAPSYYGSTLLVDSIRTGAVWETAQLKINTGIQSFLERRKPYLIY